MLTICAEGITVPENGCDPAIPFIPQLLPNANTITCTDTNPATLACAPGFIGVPNFGGAGCPICKEGLSYAILNTPNMFIEYHL